MKLSQVIDEKGRVFSTGINKDNEAYINVSTPGAVFTLVSGAEDAEKFEGWIADPAYQQAIIEFILENQ